MRTRYSERFIVHILCKRHKNSDTQSTEHFAYNARKALRAVIACIAAGVARVLTAKLSIGQTKEFDARAKAIRVDALVRFCRVRLSAFQCAFPYLVPVGRVWLQQALA